MTPTDATSGVAKKLDALYEFERAPVTDDRLQPPSYDASREAAKTLLLVATLVYFVSGVAWMRASEHRRRSAGE